METISPEDLARGIGSLSLKQVNMRLLLETTNKTAEKDTAEIMLMELHDNLRTMEINIESNRDRLKQEISPELFLETTARLHDLETSYAECVKNSLPLLDLQYTKATEAAKIAEKRYFDERWKHRHVPPFRFRRPLDRDRPLDMGIVNNVWTRVAVFL